MPNGYFRWVTGGLLAAFTLVIGALWSMLNNEITELRVQVREAATEYRTMSALVQDSRGDVRMVISQLNSLQDQLTKSDMRQEDIRHQINDRLQQLNQSSQKLK